MAILRGPATGADGVQPGVTAGPTRSRDRVNLAGTARVLGLANYVLPVAIRTFAALGLADALAEGARTVAEIAESTSCAAEPTERLLRALARAEVVSEPEPGRFALTPIGELLTSDHPISMRDLHPLFAAEVRAWARCNASFQSGAAAFPLATGETYWDHLARYPAARGVVDRMQAAATRLDLLTLVRVYPWSEVSSVVDVGGGDGTFLAGLLRRFANLHGVLLDLSPVVAGADSVLDAAGVAGRCEVVAGDFFVAVPEGRDVYILKAIVSGWEDAEAVDLLRSVRAAMAPEGRVLLIDPILGGPGEFTFGNVSHLASLVCVGGPERTEAEYRRLLEAAGLTLARVIQRPTLPIIEARPA